MWNGVFIKKSSFTDHFKVVDIAEDEIFGLYHVEVLFYNTPNKTYMFDMELEETSKEAIGVEILRQLS